MARIRTIKPEFCSSGQVSDCSLGAELFFALMWMFCDDAGIHPDSPRELRARCFPLRREVTDEDVAGWIDELITVGLVVRYRAMPKDEDEERDFLKVTGFVKHQKICNPSYRFPDKPKKPLSSRPLASTREPSPTLPPGRE